MNDPGVLWGMLRFTPESAQDTLRIPVTAATDRKWKLCWLHEAFGKRPYRNQASPPVHDLTFTGNLFHSVLTTSCP